LVAGAAVVDCLPTTNTFVQLVVELSDTNCARNTSVGRIYSTGITVVNSTRNTGKVKIEEITETFIAGNRCTGDSCADITIIYSTSITSSIRTVVVVRTLTSSTDHITITRT
jgi:hypothetical protein